MAVVDPHIEHLIASSKLEGVKDPRFPLLLTAVDSWNHNIPGLSILGQIGDLYTVIATVEAFEALKQDPAVMRLELSRPASGWDESPAR